MQFLCSKHRRWLASYPLIARQVWYQNMLDARDAVQCSNWKHAAKFYGNAFEIAGLLLDGNNVDGLAQTRYTYSVIELAAVLVCGGMELDWLTQAVRTRLHKHPWLELERQLIAELDRIKTDTGNRHVLRWQPSLNWAKGKEQAFPLH